MQPVGKARVEADRPVERVCAVYSQDVIVAYALVTTVKLKKS